MGFLTIKTTCTFAVRLQHSAPYTYHISLEQNSINTRIQIRRSCLLFAFFPPGRVRERETSAYYCRLLGLRGFSSTVQVLKKKRHTSDVPDSTARPASPALGSTLSSDAVRPTEISPSPALLGSRPIRQFLGPIDSIDLSCYLVDLTSETHSFETFSGEKRTRAHYR